VIYLAGSARPFLLRASAPPREPTPASWLEYGPNPERRKPRRPRGRRGSPEGGGIWGYAAPYSPIADPVAPPAQCRRGSERSLAARWRRPVTNNGRRAPRLSPRTAKTPAVARTAGVRWSAPTPLVNGGWCRGRTPVAPTRLSRPAA
jgi:hypothetical protein